MNCIECGRRKKWLRVLHADHKQTNAVWGPAAVCPNCNPSTYQRFKRGR